MKNNKIINFAFLFMLCTFVMVSCQSDDDMSVNEDDKEKEEIKSEECDNSSVEGYRTINVGEETREMILYVPSSYDENNASPLVINFHGFGDAACAHADLIGNFYDFNTIAEDNTILVAYPQGVVRSKDAPEWDPGDNGNENINDNDPYFVEKIIENINADFNVDLNKVYAIGYSNGGMMAYGLACNSSDKFAAVGIMSGTMLDDVCANSDVTSVIHFHGIEDEVLPYDGNESYRSIPEIVDFWLNHNNIDASSLESNALNGTDVLSEIYNGGDENTSYALYTINSEFDKSGGHVWFSSDIEGKSPNQIMWEFLNTYSLDD